MQSKSRRPNNPTAWTRQGRGVDKQPRCKGKAAQHASDGSATGTTLRTQFQPSSGATDAERARGTGGWQADARTAQGQGGNDRKLVHLCAHLAQARAEFDCVSRVPVRAVQRWALAAPAQYRTDEPAIAEPSAHALEQRKARAFHSGSAGRRLRTSRLRPSGSLCIFFGRHRRTGWRLAAHLAA